MRIMILNHPNVLPIPNVPKRGNFKEQVDDSKPLHCSLLAPLPLGQPGAQTAANIFPLVDCSWR
jgi:hypothetical protein